jgi:hypothetical protein
MFLCGEQSCSMDEQETSLLSLSTTEAEYIAAGSCCTQLLWMKTLLGDYGFSQDTMIILVLSIFPRILFSTLGPSTSTSDITSLRDLVESEVVSLSFIPTENQLADILTKPLDGSRFASLRKAIGVCAMS